MDIKQPSATPSPGSPAMRVTAPVVTAPTTSAHPPPEAPEPPAAPASPSGHSARRLVHAAPVKLDISSGIAAGAERIVVYADPGLGKSTIAAFLPKPLFIDIEGGTRRLPVARVPKPDQSPLDWLGLRGVVAALIENPRGVKTVVLDSATVAENLCRNYIVDTRPDEKGRMVSSIEGYGFGKGMQHVAEEFDLLIADFDRLIQRHSVNVCLIAHAINATVTSNEKEDYVRSEPHLYAGDKNKRGSIRDRVFQWSDFCVFISFDKLIEDSKAVGSGTRTAYTQQLPKHLAKSRGRPVNVSFTEQDPARLWRELGIVS